MTKIMLEVDALSVFYGNRQVLKEVSLNVSAGEVLAVIGPNGAGKSTLVRSVCGVLPLGSGAVRVDGRDLNGLSHAARAQRMAVVPQARQLPGAYTVYETVLLGRTPYMNWFGRPGAADVALAQRAMEMTRVARLAERRVGELSGGEQQRVLLARALAQATPLLLMDEPTTHLDLQHQSSLLNLVKRLAGECNLAVLVVLHDLNLAGLYADRVALLVDGQVAGLGKPEQVLTGAKLSAVYQIPVHVIAHPDYGTPLVLPDGRV
jgi:iron complex transport system ATP-binding protein